MKPLKSQEQQDREEQRKAFITMGLVVFIVLIVFFLGIYFIVKIIFNSKNNSCLQNPFGYSVTELEEQYGYKFFAVGKFDVENSPLVIINSSGAYESNG